MVWHPACAQSLSKNSTGHSSWPAAVGVLEPRRPFAVVAPLDDAGVIKSVEPENGLLVNTHLIELPSRLLAVDAQFGLPYAAEVVEYAKSLDKPISLLYS